MYSKNKSRWASRYDISGTTGVVIHYIAAKGLTKGITGVDVFSYDPARGWRAQYSQHTAVR